jgi:hypothetical protein
VDIGEQKRVIQVEPEPIHAPAQSPVPETAPAVTPDPEREPVLLPAR